jgi:hypothetical protein
MHKKSNRVQRWFAPLAALLGLAAGTTASAVSYHETVLADQPAAYYRLEDPAGSSIITNAVNPDTLSGSAIFDDYGSFPLFGQAGVGSNSVSFHTYTPEGGTAQKAHVEVPYAPELNPEGAFTVEFWARATSWGNTVRCVMGNISSYNDGWWFRQEAGTTPRWLYVQNGGGIYMAGGNITKNEWTHLVVTYDGTKVYFYANGVEQWTSTGTVPKINIGQPLCLGGEPMLGGEDFFDGNLDEVAIYAKSLTVDQIKTHYAVGLTNIAVPPVAPFATREPAAASAYAGRTATFSIDAGGTSPLTYQWYKGNTPIAAGTSDILAFNAAYADNGATYKVVVTNLYGSITSTPAVLTVMTDLTLESSPVSITRNVGSKAAFIAVSAGALPVTYQWYKGTTLIPGATNQVLWLSNLKLTDDQTTYYARITNPWANTDSDPAILTVVERPITVPATGYAKVVLADDPVAFWRLDESEGSFTAVDAAGTFDGEYAPGAGTITYGVDTGIPGETNKAVSLTDMGQVKVPWALELNPRGPFTVEFWIQPASPGEDYRVVLSSMGKGVNGNGPNGWLLYHQGNKQLTWVLFGQRWNAGWLGDSTLVEADTWYHVALTYDGALFRSYVNGNLSGSVAYGDFVPNGDDFTSLGSRSDGGGSGFDGVVDDVAFYNKALSLEQLQAHHSATIKLSVIRSGNNIVLSWPFGTLQQVDQVTGSFTSLTTATSPYTTAIGSGAKYYRVKVQ